VNKERIKPIRKIRPMKTEANPREYLNESTLGRPTDTLYTLKAR